ncbi:hypothetical protein [uncultured Desulfobulbus sp.]|uniref:hypothetical protein n=1 Tax=uncultured Desulfobulbus sp. TaxID=239745 RepID=UPI0029C7F3F8|nr:hypothetical protein [uncultured Desulfobulbus sp.]
MESTLADQQQLFRSCEILFGRDLHISGEFLEHLQPGGLKGAYRKRALETHPDRLIGTGRSGWKEVNEGFYTIRNAYENLLHFLKAKETRSRRLDTLSFKAATVSRPSQREHSNPRKKFGPENSPNEAQRPGSSPWKTTNPSSFHISAPNEGDARRQKASIAALCRTGGYSSATFSIIQVWPTGEPLPAY